MIHERPGTVHPLAREAVLERRAFLAGLARAGVVIGSTGAMAAALAACSRDGGGTAAPGTSAATVPPATATAAAGVAPYDPDTPYWLQGNFAAVRDEVEAFDLPVTGALPPELTGLYVRNGSNPQSGTSGHWFLGDGMLHGVALERGRAVWYRNRYVRTPLYERAAGLLDGGPPGRATNQSNVSVFAHGGRLLTSGEIGWPFEIDPADLATVGPFSYDGRLQTAMTAHPKIDPATGRLHFFGYGFLPPFLTYHVAEPDGTLVLSQEVAVKGPTMIHDFAITDRDVVFWEGPVVFSIETAIKGGSFPFRWDPDYGARIGIMPLGGPATEIRWVEIEPCYVFHGANAHRDGDDVVLDVCRLPAVFKDGGDLERSALHRWRVGTAGERLTFRDEQLNDLSMDLPSIDRRHTGRPQRHAWFAGVDDDGPWGFEFAGVVHWDFERGSADRWEPGPLYRAGEAVFVPASERAGEGEGWVLTYAYDRSRDASDLVVLDAQHVAGGPVARVHLPVRVPYGFHGTWLPA